VMGWGLESRSGVVLTSCSNGVVYLNCSLRLLRWRVRGSLHGTVRGANVHLHSHGTSVRLSPVSIFERQQCEVRSDCAPRPITNPFPDLRPFDIVLGPERHVVEPVRQVGMCCIDDGLLNCWRGSTRRDNIYNSELATIVFQF
jgi:hypothetical protein